MWTKNKDPWSAANWKVYNYFIPMIVFKKIYWKWFKPISICSSFQPGIIYDIIYHKYLDESCRTEFWNKNPTCFPEDLVSRFYVDDLTAYGFSWAGESFFPQNWWATQWQYLDSGSIWNWCELHMPQWEYAKWKPLLWWFSLHSHYIYCGIS